MKYTITVKIRDEWREFDLEVDQSPELSWATWCRETGIAAVAKLRYGSDAEVWDISPDCGLDATVEPEALTDLDDEDTIEL